jgi:ABC-type antimicrobial peptide transport system permease subunit
LTRRHEFGIRLALGGSPRVIRRLVLREALLLAAAGIGTGAIIATVVSGSLRAVLFGITATDWRVYVVVALAVLACAFLATFGPAQRAAHLDPMSALRAD